MRGIYQTIFIPPDGDCWRACIASILEFSIEEVPNITGYGQDDDWYDDWQKWLVQFNLQLLTFPCGGVWKPTGYGILGTITPSGLQHATVCLDGIPVWNPMPGYGQRIGNIGIYDFWTVFAALDPSRISK